ncbi:PD-(D/E)XK nuclease family protein [Aliterella atlantica]|uniref:PD-(D/E)XK endonuclease-like domain-containing protein n=2 Tax=Aliterella TaxID=1827277 RepID=A0A0D8ZT97_9CYAN|nr:hypothetical protein UH38_09845 [Aliterella atlantica CENA595]
MAWRPSASFHLWSLFEPAIGQESLHCDMKRGFSKARSQEPAIKALNETNTKQQQIGHLAQKGVYEFHQNNLILDRANSLQQVTEALSLNQEPEEVRQRIISVLKRYQEDPILLGKEIIRLSRGDEGIPKPILIEYSKYQFNLYAATDCIFREPDGTLHILDFKTGKSEFDLRQGYVYLLAASYLYPNQPAIASFYNLENGKRSAEIAATPIQLKAIQIEFSKIAQKHQKNLASYRKNPDLFDQIFPANPGSACRSCSFNSICNYSVIEVSI